MGIFWQIVKLQSDEFRLKEFFKNLLAILQNIVDMIAHHLLVNLTIFCHETVPLHQKQAKTIKAKQEKTKPISTTAK